MRTRGTHFVWCRTRPGEASGTPRATPRRPHAKLTKVTSPPITKSPLLANHHPSPRLIRGYRPLRFVGPTDRAASSGGGGGKRLAVSRFSARHEAQRSGEGYG